MGYLIYDNKVKALIEDRALTHLQMVIVAKLRRREPFCFSWDDDPSVGNGHTSVWLNPGSRLTFVFHGSREPAINRAWADVLASTANSSGGLYLVHEPDDGSPVYEYVGR